MTERTSTICIVAAVCAVGMALLALSIGRYAISPTEVFSLLVSRLTGETQLHDAPSATVLFDIRMPRMIAAFMVGAALAAAGAAYQNLFHNPLVSPDILGVSSGAALGAVIGIFFSWSLIAIQLSAFMGGIFAVAMIVAIGRAIQQDHAQSSVVTMVLTGVVVSSLLGACIALAKYLADPYNQLPAITYWLLGSFASLKNSDLIVALPVMLIALVPIWLLRWRINLLSLPDDEAQAVGLDVWRTRLIVIICATLLTAAAVAICGIVGWVGLVVPHAVRLMVGAEFSRLLPITLLVGGTFMLAVDTASRTIASIEIPPGVLTAVIGTPTFIWLMVVTFRRHSSH